jgi:hypothetical protein
MTPDGQIAHYHVAAVDVPLLDFEASLVVADEPEWGNVLITPSSPSSAPILWLL